MAVKEFLHVSICISDSDKSLPFYTDILGFKLIRTMTYQDSGPDAVMDLGPSKFTVWLLTNGTYRLELIQYDHPKSPKVQSPPKMNHLGLSHLTVGVDDAVKSIKEFRSKGIKVLDRTLGSFAPENPESMFLFEDPDGFLIEAYTVRPGGELPYS